MGLAGANKATEAVLGIKEDGESVSLKNKTKQNKTNKKNFIKHVRLDGILYWSHKSCRLCPTSDFITSGLTHIPR